MTASICSTRNGVPSQLMAYFAALIFIFAISASADAAPAIAEDVSVSASVHVAAAEGAEPEAKLVVTAHIPEGLHIYAQTQPKPFLATRISVDSSEDVRLTEEFRPVRSPIVIRHKSLKIELHEFEHEISWEAPIEISAGVDVGSLVIKGEVFAQACDADSCFPPQTYQFAAEVKLVDSAESFVFAELPPVEADQDDPQQENSQGRSTEAATAFSLDSIEAKSSTESSVSIWAILPLAFVAGFILNFMPCVLPVVGLKVLSFVSQADNDRRRIFMLNLFYSLGIISVLLVLATLAAFAGLGWGEQFSSVGFTVVLASIVFAFALSFLGVWEIMLPGFVGSIGGAAEEEGLTGAFSKGVLSTVLATPCSGPFLGSALAWAVIQPTHLTFLVFATVGLGMASPFLAIGFFPSLVKWLPKPGPWMKGFKELMGFVLIATVIFLLSFIQIPALVPTVALLAAVGMACWWYGGKSLKSSSSEWWRLATSMAIVVFGAWLSFGWLYEVSTARFDRAANRHVVDQAGQAMQVAETPVGEDIPWQPYSEELLEQSIASGKTVFVDFTADWCLTCKANESVAINQPAVADLIQREGIVAIRADKTAPSPDIDRLLRKLGNNSASIPFYAVFPEDSPTKPVTLEGIFSSPEAFVSALATRKSG
ncbi:protein-disulfide reductase DsbD family protein [Mariniblastus fucicola]|uniref:Thiol:disulfide interchange protein DsbD n=1 Tax=Mariniblastus fucicola TaxID=980251 RepID=A0A5B9P7W3_9BACT|nr:thioredoxin family protein [Mariniblastus fucicola]QEG21052.1 Thiol:disulfide interchange protein DsbD precursor [Mariniblastus fucicola]